MGEGFARKGTVIFLHCFFVEIIIRNVYHLEL